MEKVLSGVRVLDFIDALAGPHCTALDPLLNFTNSKASIDEPPSAIPGDNTKDVLRKVLHLGGDEIRNLKRQGVIFDGLPTGRD